VEARMKLEEFTLFFACTAWIARESEITKGEWEYHGEHNCHGCASCINEKTYPPDVIPSKAHFMQECIEAINES
jgi:hypothetical protein